MVSRQCQAQLPFVLPFFSRFVPGRDRALYDVAVSPLAQLRKGLQRSVLSTFAVSAARAVETSPAASKSKAFDSRATAFISSDFTIAGGHETALLCIATTR
jgi:hypothetical protein